MPEPDDHEPKYSISTRLQRVTEYEAYVSVPVTDAVLRDEPEADGSFRIDIDKLWTEAIRLAHEADDWQPTGTRVVPHPTQKAPDHVQRKLTEDEDHAETGR